MGKVAHLLRKALQVVNLNNAHNTNSKNEKCVPLLNVQSFIAHICLDSDIPAFS